MQTRNPSTNDIQQGIKKDDVLEKFGLWFHEAANSDVMYVAAMTRRCPNIIQLLLESSDSPVTEADCQKFLTENGLLMQSEEIARIYCETGSFPHIGIIDDILVHGRSLTRFLQSFYNLIEKCVTTATPHVDKSQLKKQFYQGIHLWVYAVNDTPILLKQEYQWSMHYHCISSESKWRRFSRDISDLIFEGTTANTSYVLSARMDLSKCPVLNDSPSWAFLQDNEKIQYEAFPYFTRSEEATSPALLQTFYLHSIAQEYAMYPAVRSYICGKYRFFTPLLFLPKLSPVQVTAISEKFLSYFQESGIGALENLASLIVRARQYEERCHVFFQLICLLLSQVTLRTFLEDMFPEETDICNCFEYDTKKISRNFGLSEEITESLNALYAVKWPSDFLWELCVAAQLPKIHRSEATECALSDVPFKSNVLFAIEDIVYSLALSHEEHAKEMEKVYASGGEIQLNELDKTGEISIESFLENVFAKINVPAPSLKMIMFALSCVTQMMDFGDISLKARGDDESGYYSAIRNTEMSLSIMPRRIAPFYLKFFQVAQFFWREDNLPERTRCYFTDFVFKDDASKANIAVEDFINNAVKFSELIRDHRCIVDSILNWRSLYS